MSIWYLTVLSLAAVSMILVQNWEYTFLIGAILVLNVMLRRNVIKWALTVGNFTVLLAIAIVRALA